MLPKDGPYLLKFSYAARENREQKEEQANLDNFRFFVKFNHEKLVDITPKNNKVSSYTTEVHGKVGENTLSFVGGGQVSTIGATITNVRLNPLKGYQ